MPIKSASEFREIQKNFVSDQIQKELHAIDKALLNKALYDEENYIWYTPTKLSYGKKIIKILSDLGYSCEELNDQRDGYTIKIKW